jgi:PAS domain S-box-containing protein
MKPIDHDDVIPQLAEHLRPLFEASPDGIYIWLDETHWDCNEKFAGMFGHSVAEFKNSPWTLQRMVHADDQELFAWNYGNRVHALGFPVTFRFRGVHRDGSTVPMETEMIPLTFGGHTIAYHFVRRVSA